MRISYLLVAAASIAASGLADVSDAKVALTDATDLFALDLENTTGEDKKSLRSRITDADEERVFTTHLTADKLDKMLKNPALRLEKFAKWKTKNLDAATIRNRIKAFTTDEKYLDIAFRYGLHLNPNLANGMTLPVVRYH